LQYLAIKYGHGACIWSYVVPYASKMSR
jgi:hypothetical protein